MAERAVSVRVTGRVQGVSFRAWTKQAAEARGLSGWVCNRDDGSVAACLAGDAGAMSDMLAALRTGPPAAHVRDVEVVEIDAADAPAGPGVRITG